MLVAAEPAKPVNSPVAAKDSLRHFVLAPGLAIELVASEPQVVDPVAVRFDADGRMWVVEMRDYPLGPKEGEMPKSRIKVLEDRDGDGRYETVTVFADNLLFATGVQPWQGGVFVTMAGQVAYMKDTTGDGRADLRKTWYTGFAQQNSQLRANHPRFGLDNHLYIANGLRGGAVVDAGKPDSKPLSISGMDFRFDPRTRKFEAISGVGQFGLTFDDWGNRFVVSNRNPLKHIVLEDRYLKRNPSAVVSTVFHDVAKSGADSRLFPIARSWTTSNLHANQFTAACGVKIYRGDALPPEFFGNGFTCDPTGHLVHREVIQSKGATFASTAGREGVEFLASRDDWYSPVNLEVGPDGALYVVDMYRAVIEHPQFVPTELKQRPDQLNGNDRGRIYRIIAAKGAPKRDRPRLSQASSRQLAAALDHDNAWHRETAHRLLVERSAEDVQEHVRHAAVHGKTPAARAHAAWIMKRHDMLTEKDIHRALDDKDPRVREQAIILAEPFIKKKGVLRGQVLQLCSDSDDRVYFQAALSLAPLLDGKEGTDELAAVWGGVKGRIDDVWIRNATRICVGRQDHALAGLILSQPTDGQASRAQFDFVSEVFTQLGRRSDKESHNAAVGHIAATRSKGNQQLRRLALVSFARTARRPLTTILADQDESVREQIDGLFTDARNAALSAENSPAIRTEAIAMLAFHGGAKSALATLTEDPSQAIQIAAVRSLARHGDIEPWKSLLTRFPSGSPALRSAILDGAMANAQRVAILLDEMEAGHIKPAELSQTYTNRLLKYGNAGLRKRAQTILADAIPGDRKKMLAEYQVSLKMKAEPVRGREVFKQNCATCHRIGDLGVNVAPDISDSRTKTPVQILTDVIQPNRAIDNNYVAYVVVVADGRVLTGVLSSETATSVTLKQPEGKTVTIPRGDIEEIRSTGLSLMPDGLEKKITHQQMADLISFVKNWRYLDGKTPYASGSEE